MICTYSCTGGQSGLAFTLTWPAETIQYTMSAAVLTAVRVVIETCHAPPRDPLKQYSANEYSCASVNLHVSSWINQNSCTDMNIHMTSWNHTVHYVYRCMAWTFTWPSEIIVVQLNRLIRHGVHLRVTRYNNTVRNDYSCTGNWKPGLCDQQAQYRT